MLAIDGEELEADDDPYRLLRNKADRPVTLTLNATPSRERRAQGHVQADHERGEPGATSTGCTTNRERVAELSKRARRATCTCRTWAADGIREFIKWYYGQIDAEALVVDVRANGGGNVSRMLIERLRRQVLGARLRAHATTARTPIRDGVFRGPMVAHPQRELVVGRRHLPGMFREAGLGPLIGTPLVGRRRRHHRAAARCSTAAASTCREFGLASAKGEWIDRGLRRRSRTSTWRTTPKAVIAGQGSAARARASPR